MSALNAKLKAPAPTTHEGGPSRRISPYSELRRAVLSCLLWENQFYESGQSIAERILSLADKVMTDELSHLAIEAREDYKLRHVPLLLLCALVKRGGPGVADVIARVIQRPDEMPELLAIYQSLGNKKIAKQLQKGLARAFVKFNAYQLAKYNRNGAWTLRDVLFISHAKPQNDEQKKVWEQLIAGTLPAPDTWEVELSAGKDKKETFTRLIRERKLGGLALLRNLRNMEQAQVDRTLVRQAIGDMDKSRILPFRFTAAARYAPMYEKALDAALLDCVKNSNTFKGTTVVLVDVSGSMGGPLSGKSDLTRMDAACTLASIINGDVRVFSFSTGVVEVPHRLGMAGVEAIRGSQRHNSTNLHIAMEHVNKIKHDRIIVITDEQVSGRVPAPIVGKAYMINVASYQNGISYGGWTSISGFSENVLSFIREIEEEL